MNDKLKKFEHYKRYIIPRIETRADMDKVLGDLIRRFSAVDGLKISTQITRLRETNEIVALLNHLGVRVKATVETTDKNDSTGDELEVIVIVLEKIPQLRF